MQYRAFAQALAAAALFGVATPFSKTLLDDLQVNVLAGLLYLGAAVCLLPLVLRHHLSGRNVFPTDARNVRNLLGAVCCGGIIGPVLLLLGLKYALAASVAMWLNLETTATAIIAFLLFREHLDKWTWLGNIGIVFAGALLSFEQGWAGGIGLAFVVGAAFAWGFDNNFTAVIDGISPEDSTFWKGLIAGTTNLIIGLVLFREQIEFAWLWRALLLGGLSYGASIVLYIRSAHGLGATRSQMVFSSAPFWGVLLSLFWLSESLSLLQIFAGFVLAVSVCLMFRDVHEHLYEHEALIHVHEHGHDDGHHQHISDDHKSGTHSHVHEHESTVHSHPHWPDIHHRHHG